MGFFSRHITVTTAAGHASADASAETNCIQSMVTLQKQALVTWLVTYCTKNKGLHRCKPLFLNGAGTRQTVAVSGARFSAGLEFGGKFGVPQLVTINKSASYGFRWNRTRDF